jgi:hypothetical protein
MLAPDQPIQQGLLATVQDHLSSWSGYEAFYSAIRQSPKLTVYLVGGAIRDSALGRERGQADFDFIVEGVSLAPLLARLERAGRVTVGPLKSPRWFPSRPDTAYCDIVPTHGFNQGFGSCTNLLECLAQFDITANAIAIDIRSNTILDPYNGLEDLRERIIRMVRFDQPEVAIRAGHVLTWRAYAWCRIARFAATLGLDLESSTARWVRDNEPSQAQRHAFAANFLGQH